jgi:HNH endonuclease
MRTLMVVTDKGSVIQEGVDMVCVLDDEDAGLVATHCWHIQTARKTFYAQTNVRHPTGPQRHTALSMHRLILGLQFGDGRQVDHADGDGLNNRRSNLREASHQQNMANRSAVRGSTSAFKGVHFDKGTGLWRAQIGVNGHQRHLGCFAAEADAAEAYDLAAVEAHGDLARLNLYARRG